VLPKDVSALKQLAGNSGYHFQLLSAVIEVNELQKRKVIGKLKRNLGSLVGKRIALLGLAFKPNTTTCARRPRWCSPPGCRRRARTSVPTTPWPRRRRAS
jgi:UDP-glucose 6-dehydrogenase